jgi:hypothetical protein
MASTAKNKKEIADFLWEMARSIFPGMKKFNLFLLVMVVITVCTVLYLSISENLKYVRIITRIEWRARSPLDSADLYKYNGDLKTVLKNIVIHHSAFPGNFGIKNIQKYQQANGFNDIAYHFVIGKDGNIFEGRSINILGAHAGETVEANKLADSIKMNMVKKNIAEAYKLDPDYGSIGVCLDGDFEKELPTEAQIQSLKKLLLFLMQEFNIDKNNIMLHNEVKQRLIIQNGMHSVKDETVCPGRLGVPQINEMLVSISNSTRL